MRRLTDTDELTEFQRDILATVRDFVDAEVLPVATELDHADAYPDEIVRRLRDLGVFGLTIGEEYGGLGESLLTYALVVEELSRGLLCATREVGVRSEKLSESIRRSASNSPRWPPRRSPPTR
jgi:alkylation response protein AidB-like acyl-CoA dehydrogenase